MALIITDTKHFMLVMKFATANKCADKLIDKLDYLATYSGEDSGTSCHLYPDYAPHSFEFLMLKPDGSRWFNGGLIYSGPGQPHDGSGPAFTVSLISEPGHSWSIHT